MAAVSLDDAWQACTTSTAEDAWVAPAHADAQAPPTEPTQPKADLGHAAPRKSPDAERSHGKQEKAMQRLCNEIGRLRQQIDERDRMQTIVLYVSLAIVSVLLVVVLQSTWKLQHATDCLLWYARG